MERGESIKVVTIKNTKRGKGKRKDSVIKGTRWVVSLPCNDGKRPAERCNSGFRLGAIYFGKIIKSEIVLHQCFNLHRFFCFVPGGSSCNVGMYDGIALYSEDAQCIEER